MNYDKMFNSPDCVKASDRFRPPIIGKKPNIDKAISDIVGKNIIATDPRLMKLVVKYKGKKPNDSETPDNFTKDPEFIKELKKIFI